MPSREKMLGFEQADTQPKQPAQVYAECRMPSQNAYEQKHSSTSSNNLIAAVKPAPLHNHCAALCLQLCATLVSNNGLLAGAAVVHIVQCINLVGF